MEAIFTIDNLKYLGLGALISLGLAIGALSMGLIIGTFGAMGRLSKNKLINALTSVYVEVIRGTPMLLQILFLFLAIPMLILNVTGSRFTVNPFIVGLIALGINSGAYTTELIRAGINSVDKGQVEAGRSLGLSYMQTMRYIVLPQAFKTIVPPLVSEFIVLIKDSSLVSVIGAAELLKRSRTLGAQYYDYVSPLLLAAIMYLCMTLVISHFAKKLERKLKND